MDAHLEMFLQPFQHLKIQLEEITKATNNFDDENNRIGRGGFGNVYKGEVSHCKGRSMAAIKRLDRSRGQGRSEFLKEITMLSRYKHENLISLLGFCNQGNEMILVYEHASRGSLDRHLNSPYLTWTQRLRICLDVVKGLSYLHDPRETHQRLIHCDIKSSNILLDDQWHAKLSDFGLSIMGSANEQQSTVITLAVGTPGYIDPLYWMTNTLAKELDIYSLGVVLFEVLCGRLCSTYSNGRVQQIFVPTWIESYKQKKLNDIIFKDSIIQAMDQRALEIFSSIAYRCLMESRGERPKMAEVMTELETALESQELLEVQGLIHQEFKGECNKQRSYDKNITQSAKPFLKYRIKLKLWKLLGEGVLLKDGKTYFSLNNEGEHCEMISIAECLENSKPDKEWHEYKSRFPVGTYRSFDGKFKSHVSTQFLSPGLTYTVNLVFKYAPLEEVRKCYELISLKYKLQGDSESSISHLAYEREDGWWMAELYQFTSDHTAVDLEIMFDGFNESYISLEVEGIEFRPLEKVDENQAISDSDSYSDSDSDSDSDSNSNVNWEEQFQVDYDQDIMKMSEDSLQWTTIEEEYSISGNGIKSGIWFYLDKNGKKCYMQSAAHMWQRCIHGKEFTWLLLPESRFGKALHCDYENIRIATGVEYLQLSSKTTYAIYLVYKLPEDQSGFEAPVRVYERIPRSRDDMLYIYLVSPQTPIISPKADQNTHNPVHRPQIKGLPQQRNDGWMEVQIWEFQTTTPIDIDLMLTPFGYEELRGLIIEGIEFRPI